MHMLSGWCIACSEFLIWTVMRQGAPLGNGDAKPGSEAGESVATVACSVNRAK